MAKPRGSGAACPTSLAFLLNNALLRRFRSAERVIAALGVKPEEVVIDFGCGPGFYTIPLAKRAKRAIGIDINAGMLERAADYARKSGVSVEFYRSDGRRVPLPDWTADLVFMSLVYHELDDKGTVLKELARVLKPDGRLAIMEMTRGLMRRLLMPRITVSEIEDSMKGVGFGACAEVRLGKETMVMCRRGNPPN
jgi:ubiquinone/menaquinone biosynthesis C-methylase UbiE